STAPGASRSAEKASSSSKGSRGVRKAKKPEGMKGMDGRSGLCLAMTLPGEIDEAALDVGGEQPHPHPVADVEPFETSFEAPLDQGVRDVHPGPLLGGAGDHGVEAVADP